MIDDLVVWLRSVLDDEERIAREAGAGHWAWEHGYGEMCNDSGLSSSEATFVGLNAATFRRPALTATELAGACAQLAARVPEARVVANAIGNLAILDADGDPIGYLDLAHDADGQIHLHADEVEDDAG